MTKKHLLFFLIFFPILSFADGLTLSCPNVSDIKKEGDHYIATIPAARTQDLKPIPEIVISSASGTASDELKMSAGAAVDVNNKKIICTYNTATLPQNGKFIDLSGTSLEVFNLFTECKITGGTLADPIYKVNCKS